MTSVRDEGCKYVAKSVIKKIDFFFCDRSVVVLCIKISEGTKKLIFIKLIFCFSYNCKVVLETNTLKLSCDFCEEQKKLILSN